MAKETTAKSKKQIKKDLKITKLEIVKPAL